MPSASKAACCIAPESEWATGWPMRTTRLVMLAPFRGPRRSRGRRWPRDAGRVDRPSSPRAMRPATAKVIASRWSSRLSGRPPVSGRRARRSRCRRRRPRPVAPRAREPVGDPGEPIAISLWRSSPAPRIGVVPLAPGSRPGRGPGSRRSPRPRRRRPMLDGLEPARPDRQVGDAARPSPSSGRPPAGRSSMRAPIRQQQVDDRPASRVDADAPRVSSASGWHRARRRARTRPRRRRRAPARRAPHASTSLDAPGRRPAAIGARARPCPPATPRARSIRSVWSRVATDSRTVVTAVRAGAPASRIADLTWALGHGVRVARSPRSGVRRPTVTGGRELSPAGLERRAHAAQRIDDTGHRTASQRCVAVEDVASPADRPGRRPSSRSVVPELPQSRTPSGSTSPTMPGDPTR